MNGDAVLRCGAVLGCAVWGQAVEMPRLKCGADFANTAGVTQPSLIPIVAGNLVSLPPLAIGIFAGMLLG